VPHCDDSPEERHQLCANRGLFRIAGWCGGDDGDMRAPKIVSSPRPVAAAGIDVIPSCPLGLRQDSRACLGYYEREHLRLQIRMLMRDDEGICTVLVEEDGSSVTIRAIACRSDDPLDRLGYPGYAEERHHVWIETPLGDRTVLDYQTGKPMPFYVPTYENNRPTKAPGYYTDPDAARAGGELVEDINDREPRRRHNAPRRSRTLGY
jgi:hypothetical protein